MISFNTSGLLFSVNELLIYYRDDKQYRVIKKLNSLLRFNLKCKSKFCSNRYVQTE